MPQKESSITLSADFDPVAYINEPRWHDSRLGLDRTRELLARLGNPQDAVRFVHVAGTNGKGSTCAFIASILQKAGYRTGLFTSPYIVEFSDRIRVDGINISDADLLAVTLDVKAAADAMDDHPTEFELMTAVAFLHFARSGCDIAVAEVGLGGRLDSTNVLEHPEICVITPISLDHTAILGNTIAAIATEKAGIIKPGVPVLTCPQDFEAASVIQNKAAQEDAPLTVVDFSQIAGVPEDFSYRGFSHLHASLHGAYQTKNAALAIEAVLQLRALGWKILDGAVEQGVASTQWPGRFEIVEGSPTFVIDGGHNVQGARALVESLDRSFPDRKPVFVIGVLEDKDYPTMLEILLPHGAAFVCTAPPNPRALSAYKLARAIRFTCQDMLGCTAERNCYEAEDIPEAIQKACELAGPDGLVVICGSLYMVAEVKQALALR